MRFACNVVFNAVFRPGPMVASDVSLEAWELAHQECMLRIAHRQENPERPSHTKEICEALPRMSMAARVILSLHSPTCASLGANRIDLSGSDIDGDNPASYLQMQRLAFGASVVMTDSGGLQKEAFSLGVPRTPLRDDSESTETVGAGSGGSTGANPSRTLQAFGRALQGRSGSADHIYRGGSAAAGIVRALEA